MDLLAMAPRASCGFASSVSENYSSTMTALPELRFFSDARKFLDRVQPFLLEREAEHCLILGLLDGLSADERWGSEPPLMALTEDRGEVTGVALMTPPQNLIVSWVRDDAAIEAIARELHRAGIVVPGVNGSVRIAQAFAESWSRLAGCNVRLQHAQRIHKLSRVIEKKRAAGRLREPGESDDALMQKWRAAFSIEAEGIDRAQAEREAARPLPQTRRLLLWEVNGSAVCMAGFTGTTPNGIRIAWVYTPPENRGRGFAGACVAALSQRLLDEGRKYCFLYTDLANPISNHVYQTIGYEPVVDTAVHSFS
jgi:uncharacterized protein